MQLIYKRRTNLSSDFRFHQRIHFLKIPFLLWCDSTCHKPERGNPMTCFDWRCFHFQVSDVFTVTSKMKKNIYQKICLFIFTFSKNIFSLKVTPHHFLTKFVSQLYKPSNLLSTLWSQRWFKSGTAAVQTCSENSLTHWYTAVAQNSKIFLKRSEAKEQSAKAGSGSLLSAWPPRIERESLSYVITGLNERAQTRHVVFLSVQAYLDFYCMEEKALGGLQQGNWLQVRVFVPFRAPLSVPCRAERQ